MTRPRRFTVAPDRVAGDRVAFDADETRHLARVLRLGPGDVVLAADGAGREYTVRLDALGETATGTVLGTSAGAAESSLDLTLLQAVPRGDRMETIVRAATELGVRRVVPVLGARTVVRLDAARAAGRAARWQRVAREAAKQCGRAVVPEVAAPCALGEACARVADAALRLCLWEGDAPSLDEVLARVEAPRAAAVLVGPEGGLAAAEVEAARAFGFAAASLGPRILRTDTAGVVAVALLQFRFGDLGRPYARRASGPA
jgi:16S rRNA (uracil1498-N3)-methyltransferase